MSKLVISSGACQLAGQWATEDQLRAARVAPHVYSLYPCYAQCQPTLYQCAQIAPQSLGPAGFSWPEGVHGRTRAPSPPLSPPWQVWAVVRTLTDGLQNPLGLILPPDTKEVDRQAAEDDGKANATLHGCLPERHGNEEEAGQDEEYREGQIHLGQKGDMYVIGISFPTCPRPVDSGKLLPTALWLACALQVCLVTQPRPGAFAFKGLKGLQPPTSPAWNCHGPREGRSLVCSTSL